MALASEKGTDDARKAELAMLTAQAAQRREHPVESEPYFLEERWRFKHQSYLLMRTVIKSSSERSEYPDMTDLIH